jgi:hypothetical protein
MIDEHGWHPEFPPERRSDRTPVDITTIIDLPDMVLLHSDGHIERVLGGHVLRMHDMAARRTP